MKSEFIDWNQLLGIVVAQDAVARVPVREQVQRRARLLEDRPEQRGGEEQHADQVQPLALFGRPVRDEVQPAEEPDDEEEQEDAAGIGDLHGRDRQPTHHAADREDGDQGGEAAANQDRLAPQGRACFRRFSRDRVHAGVPR